MRQNDRQALENVKFAFYLQEKLLLLNLLKLKIRQHLLLQPLLILILSIKWNKHQMRKTAALIIGTVRALDCQKMFSQVIHLLGFPGGSVVKNPPAHAGHIGLILESGRSLGEGNDNPLRHYCLGNPMERGAWWTSQSMGSRKSRLGNQTTITTNSFTNIKNDEHLEYASLRDIHRTKHE